MKNNLVYCRLPPYWTSLLLNSGLYTYFYLYTFYPLSGVEVELLVGVTVFLLADFLHGLNLALELA